MLENSLSRSIVVAAILALTVPSMVYSLSIYDVIMLSQKDYEADDIVALIETTGSAFDLTAKDVTRLKKAGVSETVIQAMLAVVLLEPQENTNIPPKPTANQRSQETDTPTTVTGSIHPRKTSQPLIVIKRSHSVGSHLLSLAQGVFLLQCQYTKRVQAVIITRR